MNLPRPCKEPPVDLVSKLRTTSAQAFGAWPWELCLQAADRITELEKQVMDLQEALMFARAKSGWPYSTT